MPKVSVLVPIYNVEKFLHECLDSVQRQTLQDLEIICIDDGSTDGSLKIIEEYAAKDPRFKIITKENSGYGDSMNRGLDAATGEYIGIVESDDWVDPQMFEDLVKIAEEKDAEVVKSNYYTYYADPKRAPISGRKVKLVHPGEVGRVVRTRDKSHIMFQRPAIWSAIYRRDFLNDHQIRFLPTPGASFQDTGFGFKVWSQADRATFTDRAYLHYRRDNEASSVSSPGKEMCVAEEYAEIRRYLEENGLWEENRDVFFAAKLGVYFWNIDRLSPELAGAFMEQMRKEFKEDILSGEMSFRFVNVNQARRLNDITDNLERAKARRTAQWNAKVSVIMPVHNNGAYIRKSIESVLSQPFPDLELIIADDGSIDESVEIAEEYFEKDPRVSLLSLYHSGQSVARNIALSEAKGDKITFIDSDDAYEPEAIPKLFALLESSGAQLAYGPIRVVYSPGARAAVGRWEDEKYYACGVEGVHPMGPDLLRKMDVSPCNKMYLREVIENNGLKFPEGLKYEDAYFSNVYAWAIDTAAFLPAKDYVYEYHKRPSGTMGATYSGSSVGMQHLDIAFRLFKKLKRMGGEAKYGAYYVELLYSLLKQTLAYVPESSRDDIWERLTPWLRKHQRDLKAWDVATFIEIKGELPPYFQAVLEDSGTGMLVAKARSTAKRLAWAVIPSYRAAESVRREVRKAAAVTLGMAADLRASTAAQLREMRLLRDDIAALRKRKD